MYYNTVLVLYTLQSTTILYSVLQYCTVYYNTVLVLYTLQSTTILYSVLQYCTVYYNTVLVLYTLQCTVDPGLLAVQPDHQRYLYNAPHQGLLHTYVLIESMSSVGRRNIQPHFNLCSSHSSQAL